MLQKILNLSRNASSILINNPRHNPTAIRFRVRFHFRDANQRLNHSPARALGKFVSWLESSPSAAPACSPDSRVLSGMIMHLINLRLVLDVLSCNLLLHAVITSPFNAMRGSSRHSYMAFPYFAIKIYCTIFFVFFPRFTFSRLLVELQTL